MNNNISFKNEIYKCTIVHTKQHSEKQIFTKIKLFIKIIFFGFGNPDTVVSNVLELMFLLEFEELC